MSQNGTGSKISVTDIHVGINIPFNGRMDQKHENTYLLALMPILLSMREQGVDFEVPFRSEYVVSHHRLLMRISIL